MTSERSKEGSGESRGLKEYMSSMDMRIISCMREDVPVFAVEQGHPDVVRQILRGKGLSL